MTKDDHWEQSYADGRTPWDLGTAPPVLLDLITALQSTGQRVLVPGAGHGHDAIAWAAAGHHVTAVDIAPTAVASAQRHAREAGVTMAVVEADVLALPEALTGLFDLVWEQTCFCALQPAQRPAYVRAVAEALTDDGRYFGLFWQCGREGGPPFQVTEAEVRAAFEPDFRIESVEPVRHSVAERQGEFLARMRRSP